MAAEHTQSGAVAKRLAEVLGVRPSDVRVRHQPRGPDAVLEAAGRVFVAECKASGATGPVSAAIEQARHYASIVGEGAIPLVAVPFMGPTGRQRCEQSEVAWLDLSGNARIVAPGIRIFILGQPNRFKSRGRPSSAFAPKSARIGRWLLMHPDQPISQRQLAIATGMDEGFTSRIVAKLADDDLIVREPDGTIRPRDPDLLLDAWQDDYQFRKHQILRGHSPARSGQALLERVAEELRAENVDYAATGLAAAWLLTRFAGFRIVTVYLPESPSDRRLEELNFREETRGANLWLVVPNDEGVFHGVTEHHGVRCVHPVQAYLDLKNHPERAKEAADLLRAQLLKWHSNA